MSDPTDVLERAQAWLTAADERGINRTDKDGYLAVIEDLAAEVEFQRTALEGYRNEQLRMVAVRGEDQAEISRLRGALEQLRRENERAWKEVDIIARERNEHARWRKELADQLGEVEKFRDALGVALNKRENDLMAAHNAVSQMMIRQSIATGHGDTVVDMIAELEPHIAALKKVVVARARAQSKR